MREDSHRMRAARCATGRRAPRRFAHVLTGILMLASSAAFAAPHVELRLVPYDNLEASVQTRVDEEVSKYGLYIYTLTESEQHRYIGPSDGWARNIKLDGEPAFEIYYRGNYVDRFPKARPKNLAVGKHTVWPGNHVFTVAADGTISSEDPELVVSTEGDGDSGRELQVVRIKCYPVTIKARNRDPRAPEPRELLDRIPLPSLVIRDAETEMARQKAVSAAAEAAAEAAEKGTVVAPGTGPTVPSVTELQWNTSRALWLTLWLPANTVGAGYLVYPLRHTFHVTPEGVKAGAGGYAVRGWQEDGFTIVIPMTRVPSQGQPGNSLKIPGMQLLKFGEEEPIAFANLYPREDPYEFRVSESGPSLMIDGDLSKLPNKVFRVEWRTPAQLQQRGMIAETETRHLTVGKPMRGRIRALDPSQGSDAAAEAQKQADRVEALEKALENAKKALAARQAGLAAEERKVAAANAPVTTAEQKHAKLKERISGLEQSIRDAAETVAQVEKAAEELAKAETKLQAARALVAPAQAALDAAKTQATVTDNQIKTATQTIEDARIRLEAGDVALAQAKKRIEEATAKQDQAAIATATAAVAAAETTVATCRAQIAAATRQTEVATSRAKQEQDRIKAATKALEEATSGADAASQAAGLADQAHVLAKAKGDEAKVDALNEELAEARAQLPVVAAEILAAQESVRAAVAAARAGAAKAAVPVRKAEEDVASAEASLKETIEYAAEAEEEARAAAAVNPLADLTPYARIKAHRGTEWMNVAVKNEGDGYFTLDVPAGMVEGIYSLRLGATATNATLASLYADQWITLSSDRGVGVGLFTRRGRDAFYRGETFWLAMGIVATRDTVPAGTEVRIDMVDERGERVPILRDSTKEEIRARKTYVVRLESDMTMSLAPGRYRAEPSVGAVKGPAFTLDIVDPEPKTHFTNLLLGKYNQYGFLYMAFLSGGNGISSREKSFGTFPRRSVCDADDIVRSIVDSGYNAFKGMSYGMDRVAFPDSGLIEDLVRERPELGPPEAFAPSSTRDRFLNAAVRHNLRFYENLFTQHDSLLPRGEKFLIACERYSTMEAISMRHSPAFRGVCSYDEFSQSLDHDTAGIVMAHMHRADELNFRMKYGISSSEAKRRLDRFTGRPAEQRRYEDVEVFRRWPEHLDSQWGDFNTRMSMAVKSVMPDARNWTLARMHALPGDSLNADPGSAQEAVFENLEMASSVGYKDMGGWGDFPVSGPMQTDVLRMRDDLTVLPMIYGLQTGPYGDSNLRHAFFTLSQDPDGISYFQFESSPAHVKAGDNFNGVRDIAGTLCTMYGDLFLAAGRGYKKVAIHYSRAADMLSLRKPINVGLVCEGLWISCLRAGYPADFLTDRQVQQDKGMEYDVVFLPGWHFKKEVPPDTMAAYKRLAAANKILAVESDSTLSVDGIVKLDSTLDEIDNRLGASFPKYLDFDNERWWDMSGKTTALIGSFLSKHVKPAAEHGMLVGPDWLRCRQGEYLVIPNHAFTGFTGNHKTLYQAPDVQTLRIPKRPPVCYDMLEMKRVDVKTDGDWMEVTADMRYAPGKIFAFLPAEIDRVSVRVSPDVKAGGDLNYQVFAADAKGAKIDAGIPLELTISDRTGKTLQHVYRAADSVYRGVYRVPVNLPEGGLVLKARELISGKLVEESIAVTPGTLPSATTDKSDVLVSDPVRVHRFIHETSADVKPLFTVDDLVNPRQLVLRMRKPGSMATQAGTYEDTFSAYLYTRLSPSTKALVDAYKRSDEISDELKEALVADLNSVVTGDAFYEHELIPPGVLTIDEGRWGEATAKESGDLPDVNRMILESFYAKELRRREPVYIGIEEEWLRPQARRLKNALEKLGRRVRLTNMHPWMRAPSPGWSLDDDVLTGLDGMRMWRGEVVQPGIVVDGPVILLGRRKGLVSRLADRDLVADPVSDNFPGKGRAIIGWVPKAFSTTRETVYVLCGDEEGLKKGIDVLLSDTVAEENSPARLPVVSAKPDPNAALVDGRGTTGEAPGSFRAMRSSEERIVVTDIDPATGRILAGTAGYGDNLFCFGADGALLWKTFLPEHEVYFARWIDGGKSVAAATAHGFHAFLLAGDSGKVFKKFAVSEWPDFHVGERETNTKVEFVLNPKLRQLIVKGRTGLMAVDYDGNKMWFFDELPGIVEYPKENVQESFATFGHYLRMVQAVPSPDGTRIACTEFRHIASTRGFAGIIPLWRNEPQILDARTGKVLLRKTVALDRFDAADAGSNNPWEMTWPEGSPHPWVHAGNLSAPLEFTGKKTPDGVDPGRIDKRKFVPPAKVMLKTGGWTVQDFYFVERIDADGMTAWSVFNRRDSWIKERDVLNADHTRMYRSGRSGWIMCLDLETGKILWEYKMPFGSVLTPAADNHLVAGASNGKLTRLDENGQVVWEVMLRDLHEIPDLSYPAFIAQAEARDPDSTPEFYPVLVDGPDDFKNVLRMGVEQLDNGGFDGAGSWTSVTGDVNRATTVELSATAHAGASSLTLADGQLVTTRVQRRVINGATYLLEFFHRAGKEDAILAAGAQLTGPEGGRDAMTLSNFKARPGEWVFGRVALKAMADTQSIDVGFQAAGGSVLVDSVSLRPVRFPSANLVANEELHKIEPTHPADIRDSVTYNRIPQSVREGLLNANSVATFMQSTPLGALVFTQEAGFLQNGRLDDLRSIWCYKPNPIGFSVVFAKESYVSHVVLYLNNTTPDSTYRNISILANDLEIQNPQTIGVVRGNRRRFVVVHVPETVYTDNVKILPGHNGGWRDSITEIEVYGPVGGPETLAQKSFSADPLATCMFMGTPAHVPALYEDLVGEYQEMPGVRQDIWVAPAYHAGVTVMEDAMTLARAHGQIDFVALTPEKKANAAAAVGRVASKIKGVPDPKTRGIPVIPRWYKGEARWNHYAAWDPTTVTPLTTPARYAGRLIVGSADYKMHATADNGANVWAFETGGRVYSSPTPEGDEVYFGSDDGRIYKVDVDSGMLIWEFATGDKVRSSPALSGGRVFAVSWDGFLYAVDVRDGRTVWKAAVAELSSGSPAVSNGRVYVGDEEGTMHCFDANTGKPVWQKKITDRISSCPVVTPEGILFAGEEGQAAFVGLDGTVRWQRDVFAGMRKDGEPPPRLTGQPFATKTQVVIVGTKGIAVVKREDGTVDPRFIAPASAQGANIVSAVPYGNRLCLVLNTTDYVGGLYNFIIEHRGAAVVWEPKK